MDRGKKCDRKEKQCVTEKNDYEIIYICIDLASIRADRTSYQNSQPLYGRGLVASRGLSKPNLSKPRSPFILLPNSFILHTSLLFQTSFAITHNMLRNFMYQLTFSKQLYQNLAINLMPRLSTGI